MNRRLTMQDAKTLTLSSLGGALEFYDFIVFLTFASTLKVLFFPAESPLVATIMTYLTYAIAYFVRPLSGIVLAHFGDLIGRKKVFMFSLFMMAIPTLCIGLLPTFSAVGYLAPALLLMMRILQGVALGGEVPSAHVFVTEHVPRERFGIANSAVAAGLTFGVLIGHFVSSMMNLSFDAVETLDYAWRIPFILGGILGLLAVYLRRYLQETPVFLEMQQKKKLHEGMPVRTILQDFKWQTFIATLSTWLLITGVVLVLLAPNLMKSDVFGIDVAFVNKAALVATFMNIVGSLAAGLLVDRVGLRKTLFGFALLLAVTSFIFFNSLESQDLTTIGILYAVASFFLGIVACVPMIIIRLFPADVRLTGMGFSYNIGNALFAGLTTFLVPIIAEHFHPMFIAYYILFLCALGIFFSVYLGSRRLPKYI